jgi:hypothetical protein
MGFRNLFHILKVEFRIEKVADIESALMNYTKKRKIDILAIHPRKKNIFALFFKNFPDLSHLVRRE